MGLNRIIIGAILVLASTTSAHAGFWSWLIGIFGGGSGGSGSGDGLAVPEIDALSGMAAAAVVIGVALILREKLFRK